MHADAISNYSATEGADSHPASGGGTPTGDEGQIGQGKGDEVKSTCHSLIGNKKQKKKKLIKIIKKRNKTTNIECRVNVNWKLREHFNCISQIIENKTREKQWQVTNQPAYV